MRAFCENARVCLALKCCLRADPERDPHCNIATRNIQQASGKQCHASNEADSDRTIVKLKGQPEHKQDDEGLC